MTESNIKEIVEEVMEEVVLVNEEVIERLDKERKLSIESPKRNVSLHSHHSSIFSHPSINNFRMNDDNLKRILDIDLDTDNEDEYDLSVYCNNIIEKRFKKAVSMNRALPLESDKKIFKFKVYKNLGGSPRPKDNNRMIIDLPEKIEKFINSTIDLIKGKNMKKLNRSLISLDNNMFHKIKFESKYYNKWFSTDYYKIKIEFYTIKF